LNSFTNAGSETILAGQSTLVRWSVFGEVSLSINGADVTGQEFIDLSPTETTTFTLTATNPFGTTTKELTVTVLDGVYLTLDGRPPVSRMEIWASGIRLSMSRGIMGLPSSIIVVEKFKAERVISPGSVRG
jgi:hypothetical protein